MKLLFFCFFFVYLFISTSVKSDSIVIAADPWCPYNCEEKASNKGFMVDIFTTIFEASGYSVEYKNLNWARAKNDLNKGGIDGLVGMTQSPDNKAKWVFSDESVGIEQTCIYTNSVYWTYKGVASLNEVRLGVVNGYGYGPEVDPYITENLSTSKISSISGDAVLERLNKMLVRGRIDAFIENRVVMDYFLINHGDNLSHLRMAGCISKPRPVHIVFSINNPKSSTYSEALAKGIRKLRDDGTLSEILARYGISDWAL